MFGTKRVLADREPSSEPNNIQVDPNLPGRFDHMPGQKDTFVDMGDDGRDPVVLIIMILFVILFVLLGLCAFAGWWCNVDRPKHYNIADMFPRMNKRQPSVTMPIAEPPRVATPVVTGKGDSYSSELSF